MFHHSLLVYRELFAFSTIRTRYKARQEAGAPGSLPGSQLLPGALHSEHTSSSACCPSCWGTALCIHPPLTPQNSEPWRSAQHPSTWGRHSSAEPAVPPHQYWLTNSRTVISHHYMSNNPVFPSDNTRNSSAPGVHSFRYQVLLHTRCWVQQDQQHQRIHLVTQNKQVSWFISSELWFHVKIPWFNFFRVQKRSLTLCLDYSSLWETRKKNHVS